MVPLVAGKQGVNGVTVLTVDDAITPATSDYLQRGFLQAAERNAHLVVIQLNTPGGLDLAMRDIIRAIIASPMPVAVYVTPPGARAASAGTYILYAAHVAAMAPATNLGAATPVQIGTAPDFEPFDEGRDKNTKKNKQEEIGNKRDNDKGEEGAPPDAMTRKLVNDAVAYIRSLAELRGRNAAWAEKAVREGASLSAEEALRRGVIDLIAMDLNQLLQALNGREVKLQGLTRKLTTANASVEFIEADWRSRLLGVITNPTIAYILLLLGAYGLFFELMSPGYVLPGVIGAICLLLALYAFQLLPVNYAGLALIAVGIAFMVAELFAFGFGALGIGGVIAFVIGSVILFDPDISGYAPSLPLIAGVALLSAGFFMGVLAKALKVRRRPVVSGAEEMVGSIGQAAEDFAGSGWVRAHGEAWHAFSIAALKRGQKVRVTRIEGLTLIVEPLQEDH
ncbi:MAG: nodulation protein NfeD [Chromatiales bacterium]